MSLLGSNEATISGSGNNVFQGVTVKNGNIEVFTIDAGKLAEELLTNIEEKEALNIIVLCTSTGKIKPIESIEMGDLQNRYGKNLTDWIPFFDIKECKNTQFQHLTIKDILSEYHRRFGFKLNVVFIDEWIMTTLEKDEMKEIVHSAILIPDILTIHFIANKDIVEVFNYTEIGGCLVPVCETHSVILKQFITNLRDDTFNQLSRCYKTSKKICVDIALNIPTKDDLFRKLTNIAIHKFKLEGKSSFRFGALWSGKEDKMQLGGFGNNNKSK